MSEEERAIKEIKKLYLFLTEKEPTPDDEIEARDKFIVLFNDFGEINTNSGLDDLIKEIIDKLDSWDTLDLWFMENRPIIWVLKER